MACDGSPIFPEIDLRSAKAECSLSVGRTSGPSQQDVKCKSIVRLELYFSALPAIVASPDLGSSRGNKVEGVR